MYDKVWMLAVVRSLLTIFYRPYLSCVATPKCRESEKRSYLVAQEEELRLEKS